MFTTFNSTRVMVRLDEHVAPKKDSLIYVPFNRDKAKTLMATVIRKGKDVDSVHEGDRVCIYNEGMKLEDSEGNYFVILNDQGILYKINQECLQEGPALNDTLQPKNKQPNNANA